MITKPKEIECFLKKKKKKHKAEFQDNPILKNEIEKKLKKIPESTLASMPNS